MVASVENLSTNEVALERRTQLLKGVLDLCVLAVLKSEEMYGYGLTKALQQNGVGLVAEGSVYPLLTRLEKKRFLSSRRAKSPEGPTRKYYKVTTAGLDYLEEGKKQWLQMSAEVSRLFEDGEKL